MKVEVTVTSHSSHSCECNISGTPGANFIISLTNICFWVRTYSVLAVRYQRSRLLSPHKTWLCIQFTHSFYGSYTHDPPSTCLLFLTSPETMQLQQPNWSMCLPGKPQLTRLCISSAANCLFYKAWKKTRYNTFTPDNYLTYSQEIARQLAISCLLRVWFSCWPPSLLLVVLAVQSNIVILGHH